MKKEKDTENFNEKMTGGGWREIARSEVLFPTLPKSSSDIKSRITIYLDADIILRFKEKAKNAGVGYQTLINQSLREMLEEKSENIDIKHNLLQDKRFLYELKVALYTGENTSQVDFGELVDKTLVKLGKELSVKFCSDSDYDPEKKYDGNVFFYDADYPPYIKIWPGKFRKKEVALDFNDAFGRTNAREIIEKEVRIQLEKLSK
jgi:uncharacterized protein (DUF4415 family)